MNEDTRIAILEVRFAQMQRDLDELKAGQRTTNAALQNIIDLANMGKGAWWWVGLVLKIGGLMGGIATALGFIFGWHR